MAIDFPRVQFGPIASPLESARVVLGQNRSISMMPAIAIESPFPFELVARAYRATIGHDRPPLGTSDLVASTLAAIARLSHECLVE